MTINANSSIPSLTGARALRSHSTLKMAVAAALTLTGQAVPVNPTYGGLNKGHSGHSSIDYGWYRNFEKKRVPKLLK